jgi:hypothetical protein
MMKMAIQSGEYSLETLMEYKIFRENVGLKLVFGLISLMKTHKNTGNLSTDTISSLAPINYSVIG